jgi:16S rRNA processing protein RimM
VVIGEITRTHGLAGEIRVTPLTDLPQRFAGVRECVVWDRATDRRETWTVTTARVAGDHVLLALEGCHTVDAARRLVGAFVALPEAQALPPGPGRFYPWQLAGCRVVSETGLEIGRVVRIETSPAHDLWVVDAGGREVLIPAVAEIVAEVDVAARRVVVRPPDGLLEL